MALPATTRAIVLTRAVQTFPDVFPKETLCIKPNFSRRAAVFRSWKPKPCAQTNAILENEKAPNKKSSEGTCSDPARAALERLFLQSQKLDRGSVVGRDLNAGHDLELTSLESYVHDAIEALQLKEKELRAAESAVKAEEEDLKRAKSALLDREKEMEAARDTHISMKEELSQAKQECSEQASELNKLKEALRRRENEVGLQQESLRRKQDELDRFNNEMLQKDEALADAAKELEARASRLAHARDFISKQASQLGELRNVVEERERTLALSEREKHVLQEKLDVAEADLEKRAITWLRAQDQLKSLTQELSCSKSKTDFTERDLANCKALLARVRGELESSQKEIENFRDRMQVQEMQNRKQRDEILQRKVALKNLEMKLVQSQNKLMEEREQLKSIQVLYNDLKQEWEKGQQQVEALKLELQKGKRDLQESISEKNSTSRELQQKDSLLSDTQLLLQLKEAELIAVKMEMQRVNSDHVAIQLLLKDRVVELEKARKTVNLFQDEVFKLRGDLQTKEAQLVKVTSQLNEKEEQLRTMKVTLKHNSVRLSEATSFVEQIAALSRTLVDADNPGRAAVLSEETQLMQTNYQLFASNRANLEKDLQIQYLKKKLAEDKLNLQELEAELQAVKGSLKVREVSCCEAQRDLAAKDEEIRTLLQNWKVREEELTRLRNEVMEEAVGLKTLHILAQTRGANNLSPAEVATEKLEFEAARLNAEAAMCALTSLAELSQELVKDGRMNETGNNSEASTDGISASEEMKHSSTQLMSFFDKKAE